MLNNWAAVTLPWYQMGKLSKTTDLNDWHNYILYVDNGILLIVFNKRTKKVLHVQNGILLSLQTILKWTRLQYDFNNTEWRRCVIQCEWVVEQTHTHTHTHTHTSLWEHLALLCKRCSSVYVSRALALALFPSARVSLSLREQCSAATCWTNAEWGLALS